MTYYQILGISENSTQDEIIRAYRKEIFKNHPDRNKGKENEKLIISIVLNEACEILTNEEKRSEYDKSIKIVELKRRQTTKKERYLSYLQNRMKEHSAAFEINYSTELRLNNNLDFLRNQREIMSIIENILGIDLKSRFTGFDIESTDDYRWPFFQPETIFKRKYCVALNCFDCKVIYILMIEKKDYDVLFQSRKTWSVELYFNGENIKYADTILDKYIKCIIHYN